MDKRLLIGVVLVGIVLVVSLCVQKPEKTVTPTTSSTLTSTVPSTTLADIINPTLSPPLTPTSVSPAPKQFYTTVGQTEKFTYWGHDIVINYLSASPKQVVKITIDGEEKTIEKNLTADPRGVYWKEGNLSFAIKPVVWEMRDGQRIPFYEKTWNTTEVYFEVMISGVGPTSRDERQLQVVR